MKGAARAADQAPVFAVRRGQCVAGGSQGVLSSRQARAAASREFTVPASRFADASIAREAGTGSGQASLPERPHLEASLLPVPGIRQNPQCPFPQVTRIRRRGIMHPCEILGVSNSMRPLSG